VEQILQADVRSKQGISFWRNPRAWLQDKKLSRGFWIFFTAAFFFDFGFAIYYFLFNLYLLDLHFNDRMIGLVGGAMMLGSVAGMLPAGMLARKIGLRPLLLVCFVAAPLLGALRLVVMDERAQIGLAFVYGLAMCLWAVCFLPAVARVTTEENRTSAFSLIFSVSIGTSTLGGVVCGYLPQWLRMAGLEMQPAGVKRILLLVSCGIAALGLFAVLRIRQPLHENEMLRHVPALELATRRWWVLHPFLLRFLPPMVLWTAVLSSFTPFANVYLARELHVPILRIGLIFSVAQVVQFSVGLLTPLLFRVLGMVNGIVVTQLLTAMAIASLAATHNTGFAVALYLGYSAMQWMSSPGLYNLLMNRVPDEERSTASAMMMFCNALAGAGATAGAGILFADFGYPRVLVGIAVLAVVAAMLLRYLIGPQDFRVPLQP